METIESNNKFVSDTSTGDNYSKGWNLIFITFIELLVVTLVYAVIQIPTGGIQIKPEGFEWYLVPIVMLAIGYGIFISGPIGYSVQWVFLKAVRREKIEIKDMFAVFERNYWNAVIAGLIRTQMIDYERGVPYLKDIPILGRLFESSDQREEKRELLIFVTPRIVGTRELPAGD